MSQDFVYPHLLNNMQQQTKTLQSVTCEIVGCAQELLSLIRKYEVIATLIQSFDSGAKATTAYWVDQDGQRAEQALLEAIAAFEEIYEKEGGKQ